MADRRPVTEEDDRRVCELHGQGLTRNAIAKKFGRSVPRIDERLGLNFERTRTAAATAAKVVDARARRAALSLALLDDIDDLRQRLNQPCTVYRLNNEGDLLTGVITRPDARDSRDSRDRDQPRHREVAASGGVRRRPRQRRREVHARRARRGPRRRVRDPDRRRAQCLTFKQAPDSCPQSTSAPSWRPPPA